MAQQGNALNSLGLWRALALLFGLGCIALVVTLIVIVTEKENNSPTSTTTQRADFRTTFPCPPKHGGLMTSGDPESPAPFHDVTSAEYERLYLFLKQRSDLNLTFGDDAKLNTSYIYTVDLFPPAKQSALSFLDKQGPQPPREALVVIYRGDKPTPVVEEYRVGPLSNVSYAVLINNPQRRNSVEFSLRPMGLIELEAIFSNVLSLVDQKVGHILQESFGGRYTDCGDKCLVLYPTPVGTRLSGDIERRKIWFWCMYPAEFYTLHPLDFGVLADLSGTNSSQWSVERVWYAGVLYSSLDELSKRYSNDPNITKIRFNYQQSDRTSRTTLNRRGQAVPEAPLRPPVQIEPDGKRYSIQHRHVKYLHWDFDIRMSTLTGPQLFDIRFAGERIAYELSLAEIAVFYSGSNPFQKVTNFVDSWVLIGTHALPLVAGSDCPEGATFLDISLLAESQVQPTLIERAVCVFEQTTGLPLGRHMAYSKGTGSYYGGLPHTVLTVRSILVIGNYDYVVDFLFDQSGSIETRVASTGFVLTTSFRPEESPYGFRLDENSNANLHHHLFHFKVDLDIAGTANRYETLDISREVAPLPQISPGATIRQIKFERHLYSTEEEAVYKYNFDHPRYHVVHNKANKTQYGVPRAYRLHVSGMSKQLLAEGEDNEVSIPWARQQLSVTVHKDEEAVSSSPYATFDSLNPVTNFSNFISDESIVDKDLVFWVSLGTHHIPRAEDYPVTPTAGGHLSFFLLPYNYFPESPSVTSRDNIRVERASASGGTGEEIRVERNGNKKNGQCQAISLEDLARDNPDALLETNRPYKLFS